MLYRWVREQEGNPSKVDGSKNEAASGGEFERMRRELAKVKTARHILKKALAYFAVDSKRSTLLPLGTAAYGLRPQCARLKLKIEPLCGSEQTATNSGVLQQTL